MRANGLISKIIWSSKNIYFEKDMIRPECRSVQTDWKICSP